MYTAYKRQRKQKVFIKFVLVTLPILVIIGLALWFLLFRDQGTSSTNFAKVGGQVAVVTPQTKDFSNEYFTVTLPSSWESLGRQNPYSNQVYFEYQSKLKNYDNRWLRVYVDVFPNDFAITRVMPISVNQNKVEVDGVESISDECRTFTGAPLAGSSSSASSQTWAAKWKDIKFTCDMNVALNYVGAASVEEGYGITLTNNDGAKHKYFFLYIDHNVRPDYSIFVGAVKSFKLK